MKQDLELKDWVAKTVDRNDPWNWFVSTAGNLIQRARGAGAPRGKKNPLAELSLAWLQDLVRENSEEDDLAPAYVVPALFGISELHRYILDNAKDSEVSFAAFPPSVGREVTRPIYDFHLSGRTDPKPMSPQRICICDPYCGIGTLLAVPAVCGAGVIGLEVEEAAAEVARALLPGAVHIYDAWFEDMAFEDAAGKKLHYLATALPQDKEIAECLLKWIARTAANMLRGQERRAAGLASWQVAILVPPDGVRPSNSVFKLRKATGLEGYGECLTLELL